MMYLNENADFARIIRLFDVEKCLQPPFDDHARIAAVAAGAAIGAHPGARLPTTTARTHTPPSRPARESWAAGIGDVPGRAEGRHGGGCWI